MPQHFLASAEGRALAALASAYERVVVPRLDSGELPVASCFVMSAAGAKVLRRMNVRSRAVAVHVAFRDNVHHLLVMTDPGRFPGEHHDVMPGTNPADVGNGHAVIVTGGGMLDLTFGQFDSHGVAASILLVPLRSGWAGYLAIPGPEGRWAVEMTARDSDAELRREEASLAHRNPGLVDCLLEEARFALGN